MKPAQRILIPVDFEHRSWDALRFVQGMAETGELSISVTLLHVVNLNLLLPGRRIHDELCAESEARLKEVARLFLNGCQSVRVRVRTGRPHVEIIAEAEEEHSQLIVLPRPAASGWKRLFGSRTVERVVHNAPCSTLVLPRTWNITPEQYREATRPAFKAAEETTQEPAMVF